MLKYVRIAVTALSLTACVLLIALWVRSYWWFDGVEANIGEKPLLKEPLEEALSDEMYDVREFYVRSWHGVISVAAIETIESLDAPLWEIECIPGPLPPGVVLPEPWRFEYLAGISLFADVPHWFLVTLSALSGVIPWIHWSKRFSLRTLLIVTTLVAVGLGIVVVVL